MKHTLLLLALLLLPGCVGMPGNRAVPSSRIRAQGYDVELPKNAKVGEISIEKSGTNFTVKVKDLEVRNDPAVVRAAFDGQVKIVQEQFRALEASMQKLMELGSTAAKGGL